MLSPQAWPTVPSTLLLICPDPSFSHDCNFFKGILLDPLARGPMKTQVAVIIWFFFPDHNSMRAEAVKHRLVHDSIIALTPLD